MRKLSLRIRNVILMSFANKLRLVLTCSGILLGVFIYSFGNIITDSYYKTQLESVMDIPDYSMTVYANKEELDYICSVLSAVSNYKPTIYSIPQTSRNLINTTFKKDNSIKQDFRLHAIIVGVSNIADSTETTIYSGSGTSFFPTSSKLIKGRFIANADIINCNMVAVIDQFTERMMFGDEDAIGKTIYLKSDRILVADNGSNVSSLTQGTYAFTVVGVIEDNYYSRKNSLDIREQYYHSDEDITMTVNIICPSSAIEETAFRNVAVYQFHNADDLNKAQKLINTVNELDRSGISHYSVRTRDSELKILENTLKPTRSFISLIIVVIVTICGICIMSIMTFSVKERFFEIGIRKAFGASNMAIIRQIISEVLIIGLICSFISFCISYLAVQGLERYMADNMLLVYHVNFDISYLISALVVGTIQVLACALIPAIYASSVQVVKALRFDS